MAWNGCANKLPTFWDKVASCSLTALDKHSIAQDSRRSPQTPPSRLRALAPVLYRSLARNPPSSPIVSPSGEACTAIMTDAGSPNPTPNLIGSQLPPPTLPLDQPANDRVLSDYGQNWRQPHSPQCRQCAVLKGFVAQTSQAGRVESCLICSQLLLLNVAANQRHNLPR